MSFDLVKQQVDVVNEISKYADVKKEGARYKCLCPLHKEDTPSFIIYPESASWHCFGCNAGGSVIDFIMAIKHIPPLEAMKFLCEEHHIQVSAQDVEKWAEIERLRKEKREIFDIQPKTFVEKPSAKDYLIKVRGLTEQTIKDFSLGYGPMEDCIVIPIQDKFGRPIAFARRALNPTPTHPRYLNDAGDKNPLYEKGKLCYNLHNVRQNLKNMNMVFINEGYFDVITLHQCGLKTGIAFCCQTISKTQAEELKSVIDNETIIVFVQNNDDTWKASIEKNRNTIRSACMANHIRVLQIPSEGVKDLNDLLVAKGAEEIIKRAKETISADLFLVQKMLKEETVKEQQYTKAKKLISEAENVIVVNDMIDFLSQAWGKEKGVIASFLKGREIDDVDISKLKTIKDIMEQYMAQAIQGDDDKIFIGYSDVDYITRGICDGEILGFVGASGVGKTALAINILRNVGERHGVPMMFYSLEQPAPQVFERIVTIESGRELTGRQVENAMGGREPNEKLADVLLRMQRNLRNLIVVDQNNLTLKQIEKYTRKAGMVKFGEPVKLLVIDYLGYIQGDGKNLYEQVSKIARGLKGLAKELNLKIILLCQITKEGGTGGDPVNATMIRDSGSILESLDYVLAGWRPSMKEGLAPSEVETLKNDFIVKVLKSRKGATGKQFTYCFVPETLRIYDSLEHI